MNSQKYYKLIHYDNEDDYQLGHGKIKDIMTTEEMEKALFNVKNHFHLNREEIYTITMRENPQYEGFAGELKINTWNQKSVTFDDMWLCPDPNYRGETKINFYGYVKNYKELVVDEISQEM